MSHALRVALVALPLAVSACATRGRAELEESSVISFNGLAPETLLGAQMP